MDVLAEEVATFLIMEKEGCDYETATGLVLGHNGPLSTIYYDKWYELLPVKGRVSSKTDVQARGEYDKKVTAFVENTPDPIHFQDVPWPCNGTAQDMVAVKISGEERANKRRRIKELVLFWHPDKFFAGFENMLSKKDRQLIPDLVLDISKELSIVL